MAKWLVSENGLIGGGGVINLKNKLCLMSYELNIHRLYNYDVSPQTKNSNT